MKRLFIAIHIQPSVEFISFYEELRKDLRFARITWVKPENMHITLKFFGETSGDKIPVIKGMMELVASLHHPFEIRLKDVGVFGSSYQPRVVWVGLENAEALRSLGLNVLEGAEQIGWERDRQNFVPHLTIGRIKEAVDKRLFNRVISKYKGIYLQEERIERIILYESILRKEGPNYVALHSHLLK